MGLFIVVLATSGRFVVNIIQVCVGFYVIGVISDKKSKNRWDFNAFLTLKDTSNSDNSINNFVK